MAKLVSLPRLSWAEIQKHNTEDNAWIAIGGYVYEMHQFLKVHPGGAELITPYLGKDASAAFMDLKSHIHSRNAQSMLRKFRVGIVEDKAQAEVELDAAAEGKVVEDVPQIDWNRGLVLQASALGDKYQKWVHNCFFPNSAQTLKYFDNPILESLTKNPWWVIPLVWFPIVTFLFSYAVTQLGQNPATIPLFMVIGFLSWGLMEWTLHKYVFHWESKTYLANMLHFMVHGYHHIMPMDPYRLVFPPLGTAVIAWGVYSVVKMFVPYNIAVMQTAGMLFGYTLYDMTHYWVHFHQPKVWPLRNMKKHHMYHHYADHNINWGISSKFWDVVFGTNASWDNLKAAFSKKAKAN